MVPTAATVARPHTACVAHCAHHPSILPSCSTGHLLRSTAVAWDIAGHPAGHCFSVAALTPCSFTLWPQGSLTCTCWDEGVGTGLHPIHGMGTPLTPPVLSSHGTSSPEAAQSIPPQHCSSALAHILAGQPFVTRVWRGCSSSSTLWCTSCIYQPSSWVDKTTDTRSSPPPAPWAQPCVFPFSSPYSRQLFARKPWELQPGRAGTAPAPQQAAVG